MNDARFAEPRCAEEMRGADVLSRTRWLCVFKAGHQGLHRGVQANDQTDFIDQARNAVGDAVRHWGEPERVVAEHRLKNEASTLYQSYTAPVWPEGKVDVICTSCGRRL